MAGYALRLENGVDTAVRVRMGDAMPLLSNGGVGARSGFRNDGGAEVSVVAGTMEISVSPFTCWVDGGTTAAQGGYPFILESQAALTLADGHATLDRIDTVAVRIRDDAFDGSGFTDADLVVVEGTPGAGVPVLPATALPLRNVLVPATTSAGTGGLSSGNLSTDRRIYLPTGVARVASATERDALVVEAGTVAYRADTDRLEVWNGAVWKTYLPESDTGWLNIPATNRDPDLGVTQAQYRIFNGMVQVQGAGVFQTTYTIGAEGNGPDMRVGDMPAGTRPGGMGISSWFFGEGASQVGLRFVIYNGGSLNIGGGDARGASYNVASGTTWQFMSPLYTINS